MDKTKLAAIIRAAGSQDWQPLRETISAATPEEAYQWLKWVAEDSDINLSLKGLAADDDALGLTLAGALTYFFAIRVRAGALPQAMSEEQALSTYDGHEQARVLIDKALTLAPEDGLAAAFAMGSAIDPWDEDHKDRAEAVLYGARNVPMSGFMNLLSARAEKWGGSHEEMFAVARRPFDPDRPGAAALIARAHVERFLFYAVFDEAPDAKQQAGRYFSGEVIRELSDASDRVLGARAGDPAELQLAHGWLALSAVFIGQSRYAKRAVRHLQKLGGYIDPGIWGMLNIPVWRVKLRLHMLALFG